MPPPGIPNARLVNPAQRIAYRVQLGERQAFDPVHHRYLEGQRIAYRKVLALMRSKTNGSSRISPWSIDKYGCLTRSIGE